MRVGVSSRRAADPSALLERVLAGPPMAGADLTAEVTTPRAVRRARRSGRSAFTVAALDLGIKAMTPRRMAERGHRGARPAGDRRRSTTCSRVEPDGVFFSNGPGDPATADHAVGLMRGVLERRVPMFGICFGNQILGRALGFGTYKLRYGHRGINQPVQDRATGRVEVTAHNHGFAVDAPLATRTPFDTPYGRASRSATSASTTTSSRACAASTCRRSRVQYHPEAAAGPHDAGVPVRPVRAS